MIGGKHHQSVVSHIQLIKSAEQPTHLGIHVRHSSKVVLTDTQLEERTQDITQDTAGFSQPPSAYLKVFRNWAIWEADVEPFDVVSLPNICPGVVGHRREEFGNSGVRGQSHVIDGIQTEVLLQHSMKDLQLSM